MVRRILRCVHAIVHPVVNASEQAPAQVVVQAAAHAAVSHSCAGQWRRQRMQIYVYNAGNRAGSVSNVCNAGS